MRGNDGGITLILTFSPQGRRDLSLRGERRKHPTQGHPHRGQGCEVPVFTGTTGAPLRPVCAPLSRTLDSSLRWNDGACAGTTEGLGGR